MGKGDKVYTSYYGNSEWQSSPIINNNYTSICWAQDLKCFFTVADNSPNVMFSRDGETWISRPLNATLSYTSICYSPEDHLLVAVAKSSDKIVISRDGVTWEVKEAALPIIKNWNKIVYAPSIRTYVIIGDDCDKCCISNDGINWKSANLVGGTRSYKSIIFHEGLRRFVALPDNINKIIYSSDGISWKESTIPITNASHLTYDPYYDTMCAISKDTLEYAISAPPSGSSISWNTMTIPDTYKFGKCVYYPGDIDTFYVFTRDKNKVKRSFDGGITWSDHTLNKTLYVYPDDRFKNYCIIESLYRMVLYTEYNNSGSIVGIAPDSLHIKGELQLNKSPNFGTYYENYHVMSWSEELQKIFIPGATRMQIVSYDGESFTTTNVNYPRIFQDTNNYYMSSCCIPFTKYKFVALGSHYTPANVRDTLILTSTDGNTIEMHKLANYIGSPTDLFYCDDRERFYALSDNKLITSKDCQDWEIINIPIPSSIYAISMVYIDEFDMFTILCNDGSIITSADLISWETTTANITVDSYSALRYSAQRRKLYVMKRTSAPYLLHFGTI